MSRTTLERKDSITYYRYKLKRERESSNNLLESKTNVG
jgi:hypothetical protein